MKKLNIPLIHFPHDYPALENISESIEKLGTGTEIDIVNWKEFSYKPRENLFIAYTEKEIILKYRVTEKYVSALHTDINNPVYEDSCVEFFISTGNGFYYNIEFNCIEIRMLVMACSGKDEKISINQSFLPFVHYQA